MQPNTNTHEEVVSVGQGESTHGKVKEEKQIKFYRNANIPDAYFKVGIIWTDDMNLHRNAVGRHL